MSARRQIIAALSEDSLGGIATLQDVDHAEQLVDAYRAEVLAEAKVEVVAWLVKKAAEGYDTGSIASKVDRGAIRIFLGTGHYLTAMDEHRAEVLAADGQAYDGELAMLRALFRTLHLRVVARSDDADITDVRDMLDRHAKEVAVARKQAPTTFFQSGHGEAS